MINKIGCADNLKYKKQASFKGTGRLSVVTKTVEQTTNPFVHRIGKIIPGICNKALEHFKIAVIEPGKGFFSEDLTSFSEVHIHDGVKFIAPVKARRVVLRTVNAPSLDIHAKEVVATNTSIHSIQATGKVSLKNVDIDSIETKEFLGIVGEHNNVRDIKADRVYAQNLTSEKIVTDDLMTHGECTLGEVQSSAACLSFKTKAKKLAVGLGFVQDEKGNYSNIISGRSIVVMGDDGMPYGFRAEDLKTPEATMKRAKEQAEGYQRILR